MTRLTIRTAVVFGAIALVGCVDTMNRFANIGVTDEQKSTFDNATIVRMSPAFLYNENSGFSGVQTKLGARWSTNEPDVVALVLSYGSSVSSAGSAYVSFSGLDLNIDGRITEYRTAGATSHDRSSYNTVTNTIYTSSQNVVVIPLLIFKAMMTAKDTRLRVHTSRGYEDANFSIERIPGGQTTAIVHLREFMARVDAQLAKLSKH